MPLSMTERPRKACRNDLLLGGAAVLGLGVWLAWRTPAGMGLAMGAGVAAGLVAWSPLEYALHRFVLHRLPLFEGWHLEHHRQPTALIYIPSVVGAALIGLVVWVPAWALLGPWIGGAVTLGALTGYLAYTLTHHALHHGSSRIGWLQRRKYWHAKHHRLAHGCCFGVTSGFWDRVFRTASHKDSHKAPVPVSIPVVRRGG